MVTFEQDIDASLEVLSKGGILLYPTDTVWGIGCDATNEKAVARIYALKQRPDNKAMIVLVADERQVLQYVAAPDLQVFNYLQQAERPTTVIYEGAIGLASNLVGQDGSVGIRICRDPFCKHLIKRFRKPIVSTSANRSGEITPGNFDAIQPAILDEVDYVVHHRRDDRTPATPSMVITWQRGELKILRP